MAMQLEFTATPDSTTQSRRQQIAVVKEVCQVRICERESRERGDVIEACAARQSIGVDRYGGVPAAVLKCTKSATGRYKIVLADYPVHPGCVAVCSRPPFTQQRGYRPSDRHSLSWRYGRT